MVCRYYTGGGTPRCPDVQHVAGVGSVWFNVHLSFFEIQSSPPKLNIPDPPRIEITSDFSAADSPLVETRTRPRSQGRPCGRATLPRPTPTTSLMPRFSNPSLGHTQDSNRRNVTSGTNSSPIIKLSNTMIHTAHSKCWGSHSLLKNFKPVIRIDTPIRNLNVHMICIAQTPLNVSGFFIRLECSFGILESATSSSTTSPAERNNIWDLFFLRNRSVVNCRYVLVPLNPKVVAGKIFSCDKERCQNKQKNLVHHDTSPSRQA